MNRGMILKAVREIWLTTLLFGLALLIVEAVLAYALPTFLDEFATQFLQLQFFQTILRALLGTDVGNVIGPETFQSIAWVHPAVLTIVWAHGVIGCTRVPAGEIDRGTIDVLFGLPVSRWGLYLGETSVWLGSGVLVIAMGIAGNRIGGALVCAEGPDLARLLVVAANLYCLFLAVGGVAWLVSAVSDHRGRAIATVFGIVLASFLLSFLAQFWEPAQSVSFLSVLDYYHPIFILQGTSWGLGDMVVLVVFASVLWFVGGLLFARRDICTV